MQYYIETIEQIISDGALAEYGGTEKVADENTALNKYYTKLANVSADIGANHTFMKIRLVNSVGGEIKQDSVGSYETEAETTTETTEE